MSPTPEIARPWIPDGMDVRKLPRSLAPVDARTIAYLRSAPVVLVAGRGVWFCELGCPAGRDAFTIHCDNTFYWSNLVPHYLGDHAVAIPPGLDLHIAAAGFRPPPPTALRWDRLPPSLRPTRS